MTYKAQLEHLLSIAIQKSNAFIDVVRVQGQTNTPQYLQAQAEWEAAEQAYVSFLNMMKELQVSPHDLFVVSGRTRLGQAQGSA